MSVYMYVCMYVCMHVCVWTITNITSLTPPASHTPNISNDNLWAWWASATSLASGPSQPNCLEEMAVFTHLVSLKMGLCTWDMIYPKNLAISRGKWSTSGFHRNLSLAYFWCPNCVQKFFIVAWTQSKTLSLMHFCTSIVKWWWQNRCLHEASNIPPGEVAI